MKKVLVAVADYPNNFGGVSLMYVHTRNKYYMQNGISVTVLNFAADENYEIDGIPVITEASYKEHSGNYDVLISHAPNLRKHYLLLKKYQKRFEKLIFFFHGHEVVKLNEVYPQPYAFLKPQSRFKKLFQNVYDTLKLSVWHSYFKKIAEKSDFVFVSNTFFSEAKKFLRLTDADFKNNVHIIYNSVGGAFEEKSYNEKTTKTYDFITVRSRIDESTYCIDVLSSLASANPEKHFLLIGKGEFFAHCKKPENLEWINSTMPHSRLTEYIDCAKCAIMLSRRDTQGVMSCELATYGVPLIVSDEPICREVFDNMPNIAFLSNNDISAKLDGILSTLTDNYKKDKPDCYFANRTISKECDLILR